jgi:Flp pilus assembly CpaF family ATPase
MDHALVRRLRTEVADRIATQRRDDALVGLAMTPEDERQYARSLIARALADHARVELEAGRVPPSAEDEEELAAAVHAALYGVGRLQPLLDDPLVENIDINGCDRVFVDYADGREVLLEPVAESDDELVELVQTLAAYSGLSSRPFDPANPQLDLRLPDGSRLSAVMEVCRRPVVSIRRARLPKVAFEERLPNSEGQGRISMAELVRRSLRMNPSRVMVGEVLGDEIVTMLNAMSQGNDGSLSTIHANSSSEVFNRISTYALQAAERLPIEATHMLIAGAINFVIFLERRNDYRGGGTLRRYVSSIREVNGVDGRVVSSEIWAPGPDGLGRSAATIQCLSDLEAVGYDPAEYGRWAG